MRSLLLRLLFNLTRALRPRTATPPRTVLVLQFMQPLGCCVHGTTLYAGLKAVAPDVRVVVATRGLGFLTLQHDPNIDDLLEVPDPAASKASLWSTAQTIRRMLRERGIRPDLILQDGNNRRPSFTVLAALLRLAPVAGFSDLRELYDFPFTYDPSLSLIDNNLRLTSLLGQRSAHLEPAVYFTQQELAKARGLLQDATGGCLPVTAFVVQGSGGQRTGWHDDRFAAVLQHIDSAGHAIIYLGTAADAKVIERIRAAAGGLGISLAGRTSIPELAAVLAQCDLLISLDTGTLHVGRATGVPLVVLGPSWQKPLEWLPISLPHARIVRGDDRADVPETYRLDEVQPKEVIAAADSLLVAYPPSPEAREERTRRLLVSE